MNKFFRSKKGPIISNIFPQIFEAIFIPKILNKKLKLLKQIEINILNTSYIKLLF